jgi:hypothetical protein
LLAGVGVHGVRAAADGVVRELGVRQERQMAFERGQ